MHVINITEIGITAGEIWNVLDANKTVTLEHLEKKLGRNRDLILLSLGWLAREGHVLLDYSQEEFKASLQRFS
jgi:hypothetical protein